MLGGFLVIDLPAGSMEGKQANIGEGCVVGVGLVGSAGEGEGVAIAGGCVPVGGFVPIAIDVARPSGLRG